MWKAPKGIVVYLCIIRSGQDLQTFRPVKFWSNTTEIRYFFLEFFVLICLRIVHSIMLAVMKSASIIILKNLIIPQKSDIFFLDFLC